jgi:hypothetical protein
MAVKAITKRTVDAIRPGSLDQFVWDDALPSPGLLSFHPRLYLRLLAE